MSALQVGGVTMRLPLVSSPRATVARFESREDWERYGNAPDGEQFRVRTVSLPRDEWDFVRASRVFEFISTRLPEWKMFIDWDDVQVVEPDHVGNLESLFRDASGMFAGESGPALAWVSAVADLAAEARHHGSGLVIRGQPMTTMYRSIMPAQAVPERHRFTLIGVTFGMTLAACGLVCWWYFVPVGSEAIWFEEPRPADWTSEWWATPAILAGLVVVVLLCAAAGAMLGRRVSRGRSHGTVRSERAVDRQRADT